MIKLIGIDLDGTALRNDKTISPFTRHVIEDAIKSSITVVPVTGRPVSGLPDEFMNIAGIKYAVAMGNATDRIKAVARYITDDNEHDGVGKAIKEIFNFPTQP